MQLESGISIKRYLPASGTAGFQDPAHFVNVGAEAVEFFRYITFLRQ